jgi:serine/threonine protein kinase
VGDALQHMHEVKPRPVIHRDLKPLNVVVDGDLFARLVDFGISRVQYDTGGMTQTSKGMGTPAFMAPEQVRVFACQRECVCTCVL